MDSNMSGSEGNQETSEDIPRDRQCKNPSNEDLMATILSIKSDIIHRIDRLETDVTGLRGELVSKIDNLEKDFGKSLENTNTSVNESISATKLLREENHRLREKVVVLEENTKRLAQENQKIREDQIKLECHSRRNNLLFTGFPEERGEGYSKCIEKVLIVLREAEVRNIDNIVINRCHRSGNYVQGRNRPIIANLQCFLDRQRIWKARGILAQKKSKFFIDEDFPQEIRQRRAKLFPILNAAKRIPAYKDKIYVSLDKLVVNNVRYTCDNLDLLPPEINPKTLCHRESEDGSTLFFFSRDSPFSNFHPSPMRFDGVNYLCAEQAFQHHKCLLFKDKEAANKVMAEQDPASQKAAGGLVKNFDRLKWQKERDSLMKDIVLTKFTQCAELRTLLQNTGSKQLVEASSRDDHFGIGQGLNSRNLFNKSTWGENKLGLILESVRDSLK